MMIFRIVNYLALTGRSKLQNLEIIVLLDLLISSTNVWVVFKGFPTSHTSSSS